MYTIPTAYPLQRQPGDHSSWGEGVRGPWLFIFPVHTLGTKNDPIMTDIFDIFTENYKALSLTYESLHFSIPLQFGEVLWLILAIKIPQ